jgi:hypothetical protein
MEYFEEALEARRTNKKPMVGAKGIRIKGYTVQTITGTLQRVINQPGNMRNLIGLNAYVLGSGSFTDETISLNINSELVLDNISIKDQAPADHIISDPVIRINRALTGNDDIKLEVNSQGVGGVNINLVFYFSPYPPQQ